MGILDKFGLKKKTGAVEAKPTTAGREKASEKLVAEVERPPSRTPGFKILAGKTRAYEILVKPLLSEKATHLATGGKYVFAVHPRANKSEIRKAVQAVYEVHVEGVRIVHLPSKKRRYGRVTGETSAWKKAIITVRKGERIPGIIEAVG